MMDYQIKGTITSIPGRIIPFEISDGTARFFVKNLSDIDLRQSNVVLFGETDKGERAYLLVSRFYDRGMWHAVYVDRNTISVPHIEGIVEACAVLKAGLTLDDVDSVGFYSYQVPKITNTQISGFLKDENAYEIKKRLASYTYKGRPFGLSIGFLKNEPYYHGQLLELNSDKAFDMGMLLDSYWIIRRMFHFLYQKRLFPLEQVVLRKAGKNVGNLFVERIDNIGKYEFEVKCIPIIGWGDKFSALLQMIADGKIYLRHLPIFEDDEQTVTPGRFLMALVGLENSLDSLDIHVLHGEKHLAEIGRARKALLELAEKAKGDEKRIYKRFANSLERDENFQNRIIVAIRNNTEQIANFFPLSSLGDNIPSLAKDLADVRNTLAHGKMDKDLTAKNALQMHFLVLFILYLQLLAIGFGKDEAAQTVPNILFSH